MPARVGKEIATASILRVEYGSDKASMKNQPHNGKACFPFETNGVPDRQNQAPSARCKAIEVGYLATSHPLWPIPMETKPASLLVTPSANACQENIRYPPTGSTSFRKRRTRRSTKKHGVQGLALEKSLGPPASSKPSWNNLGPSMPACNRSRQRLPSTQGKLDLFFLLLQGRQDGINNPECNAARITTKVTKETISGRGMHLEEG